MTYGRLHAIAIVGSVRIYPPCGAVQRVPGLQGSAARAPVRPTHPREALCTRQLLYPQTVPQPR